MTALENIVSSMHLLTSILGVVFLYGDLQRRRAVRGSHLHHEWTRRMRVLQYFALAWPVSAFADNLLAHAYFLWPLNVYIGVMVFRTVRDFRADDDNDWWDRMKKGLRRRLSSLRMGLTPTPAASPA